MSELRPGFVRLTRTDGRTALIRVDAITAILENTGKNKEPEQTIQVGPTISIHTAATAEEIIMRMAEAGGAGRLTVVTAEIPVKETEAA